MSIREYTLDGRTIRSLEDLYEQLAVRLSLPDHFGRNLDALWDVLAADVEGPFTIVWGHTGDSKKLMGGDFDRVVTLFEDLKKERKDFTLVLEE